jgi:hypothetical protein
MCALLPEVTVCMDDTDSFCAPAAPTVMQLEQGSAALIPSPTLPPASPPALRQHYPCILQGLPPHPLPTQYQGMGGVVLSVEAARDALVGPAVAGVPIAHQRYTPSTQTYAMSGCPSFIS